MALEQSPTTDARRNDTFPTRIVLEHAGLLGRWGNTIAWTIAGISLLTALGSIGSMTAYFEPDGNVSEKYHSLSKEAPLKVAILTVSGTIMGETVSRDTRSIASRKMSRCGQLFYELIPREARSPAAMNFTIAFSLWL